MLKMPKLNRRAGRIVHRAIEKLEDRRLLSAALTVDQSMLVFNAVKNSALSPVETLTLTDTGDATLTLGSGGVTVINDGSFATADAARFTVVNAASIPASLNPGQSFVLQLQYGAIATGINSAFLSLSTNDGSHPVQQVALRGLGTAGQFGSNEPSLARILRTYEIPTIVGSGPNDVNSAQHLYPEPPDASSQEVPMQRFVKAGVGPVTIKVLASFEGANQPATRFGYYTPGSPTDRHELFFLNASESQSVYDHPQGATQFDPGLNPFGLYFVSALKDAGQFRVGYSEDQFNTWDTTDQRHIRVFPMKQPDGTVVPNTYIVTTTEWNAPAGYDFNDIVAVVSNIAPAPGAPASAAMGLQNMSPLPGTNRMIFNRIISPNATLGDVVHDTNILRINNTGGATLTVSSYTLSSQWTLVTPPALPWNIGAGGHLDLTIKFIATGEPSHSYNQTNSPTFPNGGGVYNGSIRITSNDSINPTQTVPLAGWRQYKSENENEPNLQSVVNLLAGWTTVINPTPITQLTEGSTTSTIYGEEVLSPYWQTVDSSLPVNVQQIDAYHTEGNTATIFWHSKGSNSTHTIFTTNADDGNTLLPHLSGSSALAAGTFTASGAFGFKVDGEWSDDTKNTTSGGGHHMRFFPLRDTQGRIVPNTFIMTMDYSATPNYDFNDNVYLISNVRPMALPPAPTNLAGAFTGGQVALQWAPVSYATLQGYNIYRSTNPTSGFALLGSSTSTTFTDPTPPTSGTVYYQVKAADNTTLAESVPMMALVSTVSGPVTVADNFSAAAGQSVVVNVLANDTDNTAALNPTTLTIVAAPNHGGIATVDPTTGFITYTAPAAFNGTDSFTYRVTDAGAAVSSTATVTFSVQFAPAGPTAVADTFDANTATATTVNVLLNDTDPDGTINPATVTITANPNHGGVVSVDPTTGDVTYTSAAGFTGNETFSYTVKDDHNVTSAPAVVTFAVSNTASGPITVADSFGAHTHSAVQVNVLANDSDPSGTIDPTTVTIVAAPNHGGAVSVDPTSGFITYTSAAGFTGTETFTYMVVDNGGLSSSPATVTMTVTALSGPITNPDAVNGVTGAPLQINALVNDSDATGALVPSSVTIVSQPNQGGTATVDPATGLITYTSTGTFTGVETFTYTVRDSGGLTSAPATVTVTVNAPPPPPSIPVAANDSANTVIGTGVVINVLANDTSAVGLDASSLTVVSAPAHGTFTMAGGVITYAPAAGFVGSDSFKYTVADTSGGGASNAATVSINVGVALSSGVAGNRSVTFTDADSTVATITLNVGAANVFFTGSGTAAMIHGRVTITGATAVGSINLSGTTPASVLAIRGKGGDGLVTIGGLTDAATLGKIIAPIGSLSGTLNVAGLGALQLGQINNAQIQVGAGVPAGLAVTLGSATSTFLTSATAIRTLKLTGAWTGGTTITAPSIGSLIVAGGFDPGLTLSGAAGAVPTLASARIVGAIGASTWDITGNVRSITAGSIAGGWAGNISGLVSALATKAGGFTAALSAGSIGSVTFAGDLSGHITAGSAKSVKVTGSVSGSTLAFNAPAAGKPALSKLTVAGAIVNSSITTAGDLLSLVAGSLNGSQINVGVAADVTLDTISAGTIGSSTLRSLRLISKAAGAFTNSSVIAAAITSAILGGVTTANGGSSEGLAAANYKSLSATFGGVPIHAGPRQLTDVNTLVAFAQTKGVSTFGDFEIKFV